MWKNSCSNAVRLEAGKMCALKLVNVRVICLPDSAIAINYGEKPAGTF
jgi:hypothetical protein